MKIGIATQALQNAQHNGDQCDFWEFDGKTLICIVDGLGHGPFAEQAAKGAIDYVSAHKHSSLSEIFSGCNKNIQHSRGVAMSIVLIDEKSGLLKFAGIGNIQTKLVNEKITDLDCEYGIVGGGYKKLDVRMHTIGKNDLLIMYTDGIKNVTDYGRFQLLSPKKISDIILKKSYQGRDDATVLVYKKE